MIAIQNIYYMLSYAFQVLQEQGFRSVATEEFDNTAELCAAILSKGITTQIKRGLGREYIDRTEALSMVRGRLEIKWNSKLNLLFRDRAAMLYLLE